MNGSSTVFPLKGCLAIAITMVELIFSEKNQRLNTTDDPILNQHKGDTSNEAAIYWRFEL